MVAASGTIFYRDEYQIIYRTTWVTSGNVLDFTTTTYDPRPWDGQGAARLQGIVVYRRGIITVHRQIVKPLAEGYEIVAEGTSQYIEYFQDTFPCEQGPTDNFNFHLNQLTSEGKEFQVTDGPHWADPDEATNCEWADVAVDGTTVPGAGTDPFEFIDVWS